MGADGTKDNLRLILSRKLKSSTYFFFKVRGGGDQLVGGQAQDQQHRVVAGRVLGKEHQQG